MAAVSAMKCGARVAANMKCGVHVAITTIVPSHFPIAFQY